MDFANFKQLESNWLMLHATLCPVAIFHFHFTQENADSSAIKMQNGVYWFHSAGLLISERDQAAMSTSRRAGVGTQSHITPKFTGYWKS